MSEDGPVFVGEALTDAKIEQVARYVEAGWLLTTAMNQCNVAPSDRLEVKKRLAAMGVHESPPSDYWL